MARFELLFLGDPALGISEFEMHDAVAITPFPWPSERMKKR